MGGVAAASLIIAGVAAARAAPPGPGPAGAVSITVTKRRMPRGYPLLPADVTVTLTGKALTGAPAPDMTLEVLGLAKDGTYKQLAIETFPIVILNTPYVNTNGFDAAYLSGKLNTGWGSNTVKGKITLTNIIGTWTKETSPVTFVLGIAPTGEITVGTAKRQGSARCKVCGSPLTVTLPRTHCSRCGATYRVKT